MSKNSFLLLCVICVFTAAFFYLLFEIQKLKKNAPATQNQLAQASPVAIDYNQIQAYIDQKLAQTNQDIIQPTATAVPVPTKQSTPSKTKQVTFIPIASSGTTTNTDWMNVDGSDFYVAMQDYPNASSVTFEASIKISNGGAVYVRLFDVTHSIAVSGSEVSTQNQEYTLVTSGNLNLWSGNNLYRVQIKSLNSQPASFASGRVKIIY